MSAILSTRSSINAASKVIEEAFTNRAQKAPPLYPTAFNVVSTDPKRPFATFLPYAELGPLRNKPEGSAPTYDQPFELIPTTWTYFTYALAAVITEEAQLEDPINFMGKLPAMLADSEQQTEDFLFWLVYNLAFAQNVLGSDGQPLASTVHPLAPINTPTGVVSAIGQTFSNSLGATQLTPESLQQAYILFETLLSDRGLTSRRTPAKLLCSPFLAKTAQEILGAPYAPYTNNNTPNVIKDTVELEVVRFFTNPLFWCVIAAQGDVEGNTHSNSVGFKWRNRLATWVDPQTSNYNLKTSFRTTYGSKGWRGGVYSQGA